ncbi:MAG: TolC family protein [Terriglobales bacterium]
MPRRGDPNVNPVRRAALAAFFLAALAVPGLAQAVPPAPGMHQAAPAPALPWPPSPAPRSPSAPPPGPPISLAQAIVMAQANSPQFQLAVERAGVASANQTIARSALLPSLSYNNAYLYTQGGTGVPVPRFIANNWVHEYTSQAAVHQNLLGGGLWAGLGVARAQALLARDQLEVARRGLRLTVTAGYYGLLAAQARLRAAQRGVAAAQRFAHLSRELQQGGEVALSDVLKAELQLQTAEQARLQAALAAEQARLQLAILLFPDFRPRFRLVNDLAAAPPLPDRARVAALAASHNPQLGAALAGLAAARSGVAQARGAYWPSLSLDYWYGIDAEHFAVRAPNDANPNAPALGSAAQVTLNIPVFDWGARAARLRQAKLAAQDARVNLSYAQRALLAQFQADYAAALTARRELQSLRRAQQLATRSLHLTILRYQAAAATALEVVDAQEALVTATNNLADGEAQYHTALARLQTVTGPF